MAGMLHVEGALFAWGGVRSPEEYGSLDQDLTSLQSVDLSAATDGELTTALNRFARGYISRTMVMETYTTFRARHVKPDEHIWSQESDLTAAPAKCVRPGRFNLAKRPVRYFAADPTTALMEVRPQPFQRYVIMVQRLRKRGIQTYAQLGVEKLPWDSPSYRHNDVQNVAAGLQGEKQTKDFTEKSGTREFWVKQDGYFNELATTLFEAGAEQDSYRLTYLLGKQLQKLPEAQGLVYPTAQNNYNGINVAMAELAAKRLFFPLEAWLVETGAHIDLPGRGEIRNYQGAVVQRGVFNARGEIEWRECDPVSPYELHLEIAPLRPILGRTIPPQNPPPRTMF